MKAVLLGLSCVAAISSVQAATAYEALRSLGKQKGEGVLDAVIEVRGQGGAPEPRNWKIVINDKEARGGVREFDVQGAKITGERTPASATPAAVLNMSQLNLDSEGAHTVAEREAKKTAYAYDHVNYTLRAGANGSAPVWELRLVDERGDRTATLTMAADSGKMLTSVGLGKSRTTPPPIASRREEDESDSPNPPEREEQQAPPARSERTKRETEKRTAQKEPEVDKPGNKVSRFFERAGRHIGGAFRKVGEKVSGNGERRPPARTTPPPRTTNRDANGTEYYRPRD